MVIVRRAGLCTVVKFSILHVVLVTALCTTYSCNIWSHCSKLVEVNFDFFSTTLGSFT